jgi:hypothetical protein
MNIDWDVTRLATPDYAPEFEILNEIGARIGTVERVIEGRAPNDPRGATLFCVRMDNTSIKRLVRIIANDCRFV